MKIDFYVAIDLPVVKYVGQSNILEAQYLCYQVAAEETVDISGQKALGWCWSSSDSILQKKVGYSSICRLPNAWPIADLGQSGICRELADSVVLMSFQFIILAHLLPGGRISFMPCAHLGLDEIWFKSITESKQLISRIPPFIL